MTSLRRHCLETDPGLPSEAQEWLLKITTPRNTRKNYNIVTSQHYWNTSVKKARLSGFYASKKHQSFNQNIIWGRIVAPFFLLLLGDRLFGGVLLDGAVETRSLQSGDGLQTFVCFAFINFWFLIKIVVDLRHAFKKYLSDEWNFSTSKYKLHILNKFIRRELFVFVFVLLTDGMRAAHFR